MSHMWTDAKKVWQSIAIKAQNKINESEIPEEAISTIKDTSLSRNIVKI